LYSLFSIITMFKIHKGKTWWIGCHPNLNFPIRNRLSRESEEQYTSLMVPNFPKRFSISRRDVRGFSGETCKR
jgi:hypothetical protein